MRVLVTGGRDFEDRAFLFSTLTSLHGKRLIDVIIHGAARGADTMADEWAEENGITRISIPVKKEDWRALGKRAGHIRNGKLLNKQPDLVVAFAGGRGTADMVQKAKRVGVEVLDLREGPA